MSELKSNPDLDKRLKFLKKIKETQVKLNQPGIERKFSDNQIEEFKEHRRKWRNYVETVQINIATVLVNQLEQNEAHFEAGIEAINQEIQDINDTVSFLNLFGRTIGILGRIIKLAI